MNTCEASKTNLFQSIPFMSKLKKRISFLLQFVCLVPGKCEQMPLMVNQIKVSSGKLLLLGKGASFERNSVMKMFTCSEVRFLQMCYIGLSSGWLMECYC